MLSFLPAPILLLFNFTLIAIVTIILALPIFIQALIRLILPTKPVLAMIDRVNQVIFFIWTCNVAFILWLTNKTTWDIQGADIEKIKGSCFIISNHVTWTDIIMLGHIYRGKIPITKFFLKHSLIYIPVLGQACYSLGMPFLRRYSSNTLLKHPELKNKDINATRKACAQLLSEHSSLVNFVEGTRFTPAKAQAQKSPYRHLMQPKAASLAIALGLIGKHIDCLLNTTLIYPGKHKKSIFLEMMSGRLKHVIARVEVIDKATIEEHMIGDYLQDKQFKHTFTMYLRQMWQQKDELIERILQENGLTAACNPAALTTTAQEPATAAATTIKPEATVPATTTATTETATAAPAADTATAAATAASEAAATTEAATTAEATPAEANATTATADKQA